MSFENYFLVNMTSNIDVEQLILILLQIESKFSYCHIAEQLTFSNLKIYL